MTEQKVPELVVKEFVEEEKQPIEMEKLYLAALEKVNNRIDKKLVKFVDSGDEKVMTALTKKLLDDFQLSFYITSSAMRVRALVQQEKQIQEEEMLRRLEGTPIMKGDPILN